MAHEINGELVLNKEETVAFVQNMIHPDLDAIRRRDIFCGDAPYIASGDEVTYECSDIDLRNLGV